MRLLPYPRLPAVELSAVRTKTTSTRSTGRTKEPEFSVSTMPVTSSTEELPTTSTEVVTDE
jgi:hypothetical protein